LIFFQPHAQENSTPRGSFSIIGIIKTCSQTDKKFVLNQLRNKEWNWLELTLRSNDSTARHAPYSGHHKVRETGRLNYIGERNLEKDIWTDG